MYTMNLNMFVWPLLLLFIWAIISTKRPYHMPWARLRFGIEKFCPHCNRWRWFIKGAHPLLATLMLILIAKDWSAIVFLIFLPKYCVSCHCRASKASFDEPLSYSAQLLIEEMKQREEKERHNH